MKLSKKSTLTFARSWICLFILLAYQLLSKYNPAMSFEITDYVYYDDYSNVNCLELIWNQDSFNFFIKYLERTTNYDKTYFSIFITIELEKKSCYLLSKGPYWKKSQDPHYCNILAKIRITGKFRMIAWTSKNFNNLVTFLTSEINN